MFTFQVGLLLIGIGLSHAQDPAPVPDPATTPTPTPGIPPAPVTPAPQPTPGITPAPGDGIGPAPAPSAAANPEEQAKIAEDAWVYGYPMVLMEITRRQSTNVAGPTDLRAPMGEFARATAFPTPEYKSVVRPNVDTLYASGWVDLSDGPVGLHVPDTGGRYYVVPILDAWSNVAASIGSRTTGTAAGDFLLVGPGWSGAVPNGMREVRMPTNTAWILGRVMVNGPTDLTEAKNVLDQMTLSPMTLKAPTPGRVDAVLDQTTPPPEIVARMDGRAYFSLLAELMAKNPPSPADAPALARFATIGLTPGAFTAPAGSSVETAVANAGKRGLARIRAHAEQLGRTVNGWRMGPPNMGAYGTNYEDRAAIALVGLGANRPEDAMYISTDRDDQGRPLDGAYKYELRFPAGQEPPARAFWSVTVYDAKGYLAPNPLARYDISSRDVLARPAEGGVNIGLQHEAPGDGTVNWLPTPTGPYNLTMRLYWPEAAALQGGWQPPAVHRVDEMAPGTK